MSATNGRVSPAVLRISAGNRRGIMLRKIGWVLGLGALLIAKGAWAADVTVTGIHNCCGNCNRNITTILTKAGATDVKIKPGEVTFSADKADDEIGRAHV